VVLDLIKFFGCAFESEEIVGVGGHEVYSRQAPLAIRLLKVFVGVVKMLEDLVPVSSRQVFIFTGSFLLRHQHGER